LTHTFLREYSYKRLKLAQLLGQRGVFLTCTIAACTACSRRCSFAASIRTWEKQDGLLSQGVQEGRQALRIRHINGVEVHRKRPRGFK
jgi:hypothetical protein